MRDRQLRDRPWLVMLVVFAVVTGCDSTPTESGGSESDAMMAAIAMSLGGPLEVSGDGEPTEHACPAGGRMLVEGSHTFEHLEGDVIENAWDQVVTREDCALAFEFGVAVANGEMHLSGVSRFGPAVDGRRPILMQESSQVGSMTTAVSGRTHSCDYDLSHSYDPESNRYHVTGTACDREIDFHLSPP